MPDATQPPVFEVAVTITAPDYQLQVAGGERVQRIPCEVKRLADTLSYWMNLALRGSEVAAEIAAAVRANAVQVSYVLCRPDTYDLLDIAQQASTDGQSLAHRVGAPVVRAGSTPDAPDGNTVPYRLVPIQR